MPSYLHRLVKRFEDQLRGQLDDATVERIAEACGVIAAKTCYEPAEKLLRLLDQPGGVLDAHRTRTMMAIEEDLVSEDRLRAYAAGTRYF